MKNQTLAKVAALGLLTVGTQVAYADADIAVHDGVSATPIQASTNVDLCVTVPEILIFGVGNTGDEVAKLSWTIDNAGALAVGNDQTYSGTSTTPFDEADLFSGTAQAAVDLTGTAASGTLTGTNQADLPVFLFSNSGEDVVITSTITAGPIGGGAPDVLLNAATGTTIPIGSFTPSAAATAIPQPALANNATSTTAASAAGIVNVSDTWTYSYTPGTVPAAGTYEARVTYVATTP